MEDQQIGIPPTLAKRPIDRRRGLPIPPVSLHGSEDTEYVDFTVVNGPVAARLAADRRCSLCGWPMAYWVAFLGTPAHQASRRYLDPPGHPECMAAATRLCPFIAYRHHRRAKPSHVRAPGEVPAGYIEGVPTTWILGITRQYRLLRDGQAMIYIPAPFVHIRTFHYDDADQIQEAP